MVSGQSHVLTTFTHGENPWDPGGRQLGGSMSWSELLRKKIERQILGRRPAAWSYTNSSVTSASCSVDSVQKYGMFFAIFSYSLLLLTPVWS
jgi:hypothetical protein